MRIHGGATFKVTTANYTSNFTAHVQQHRDLVNKMRAYPLTRAARTPPWKTVVADGGSRLPSYAVAQPTAILSADVFHGFCRP